MVALNAESLIWTVLRKNRGLLTVYEFYQLTVIKRLSGNISKRCTQDLPVVNTQGSITGFLAHTWCKKAVKLTSEVQQLIQRSHWEVITIEPRKMIARKQRRVKTPRMTRIFVYLPFGHSRKCFFTDHFFTVLVDFGVPFSINFLFFRIFSLPKNSGTRRHLFGLVSFVDWKISKHVWDVIVLRNNFIRNVFPVC